LGAVVVLGGDPGAPAPVAEDPTTSPRADGQEAWVGGGLARYSDDGRLELRPGATELERIESPLGADSPDHHSVALSLDYDGEVHWVMLEWKRSPEDEVYTWSSSSFHPGGAFPTLQEWVEDQLRLQNDPENYGHAEYLDFAANGSLVTTHGIVVLEQRHPIRLHNFVPDRQARTAAALLQGPDGKKWYVLVRELDGKVDTMTVPFENGGADLDAFMRLATDSFAKGEGLR
jgi:hypothetical protein